MKRIFIITQSEPFYVPKMIKLLAENQDHNYKLIGCTVLSPNRKSKSIFHWFKERIVIYNIFEIFLVGASFIYVRMANFFLRYNSPYSTLKILSSFGILHIQTNDINSDLFVNKLKMLNIDHIVSISSPQLFKQDLINVSNDCCLNAHGTLLPRHRGVFGSWWTLFDNDIIGGSTIHKLVLKLDSGDIVWQKSFIIKKEDTQYSIAFKTKRDMAYGLVELFKNENKIDKIQATENVIPSYHRAPSAELGKKFHGKGKRIIKLKDISNLISSHF